MVKFSKEPENPATSVKAKGDNLRVHFKQCREVAAAIRGMSLEKAKAYLADVLEHKRAIAFRRYISGCSQHAQGKPMKSPGNSVRWPEKATRHFIDLLENAEANAEVKTLKIAKLYISHIQVNRAPQMNRRTYRAHGRINAYKSNPAHIQIILSETADVVEKAEDTAAPHKRISRKRMAQIRLKSGGGVTA